MRIKSLRNQLLLSAVAVSILLALAYMSAVSWVIRQQHLEQSNALLLKAARVIEDSLAERKANLLAASRQLAGQKNLGSTLWYLTQYARSDIDRETLFNTYQQIVRDTHKIGHIAKVSRIAIYNSAGKLISFSLFDHANERAGFVAGFPNPSFKIATLKEGEEFSQRNLRTSNSVAGIDFELGAPLPQQESVRYAEVDGLLSLESRTPIMGETFSPATGKSQIKQLGLVVMVIPLDQPFVDHLSRLTDTAINIFTPQGFSSGSVAAYRKPEWSAEQAGAGDLAPAIKLNEIMIEGAGFYQGLIPLYTDHKLAGSIATLHSKNAVQKNTREAIRTLVLIAVAGLLFVFPLAWYFASSISRPLTVLSRIFRGVASGRQDVMLSIELSQLDKEKMLPNELGDLKQSFIAMADAVNQNIRQINQINASLEQTIEERTAALVIKEQESRTLIENSPDTVARYDRECRRTYVNPAFAAMAEGGIGALLGKKPSENPGGSNAAIYEAKIKEVFASGKDTHFELKWPGKDGREYCSHIRLTAEFDAAGGIATVLGVGRDITDQKETERQLGNLLVFNKTILDRSPSGIAVYMESGPCIMANEAYAQTIGATVENMLQQNFRHNVSWQRNGLLDITNQVFATGRTIQHDIEGVTSFGKSVILNCIFSPIDIVGRQHLLLITNDISERAEAARVIKESMRQLEEKELAKTRFLAAAGHDLRQPLAAANLFIDALKFTEPSPGQSQIIQRLGLAMGNFNELLDALLNISKLDAGIIRPEYTAINVTELMNWLEQNFVALAAEKQLGFKLHFSMRERLVIHSDIGLVKSVLMNLVSNALKFTTHGAILISARRRGGNVLFQVWDTGMGIQGENIERIFDEFYQINNPQRDRSRGLGLGLSIAKRALTLVGGKITCCSQVGLGSVFGFLLPADPTAYTLPQQAAVAAPDDVANEQFARGKRFVLVEDDTIVAQAMINLLEGMGGEVKCFHSAEEALRHSSMAHADCYIADYMLGGTLNGIQFLNQLRKKLGKPISAVLVTGDTSATTLRHTRGFDWPVLHKPVNSSQLISNLRAQISSLSGQVPGANSSL